MKPIFAILLLFLSACSLPNQIEPTVPPQPIARASTLAPTDAPTRTRTFTPTASPTPSPTATATWTRTPTPTPTLTSRPTRNVFALDPILGNARAVSRAKLVKLTVPPPGAISPALFGINYWKGKFNRKLRSPLAELNFTVMRWGGENYEGSAFEWSELDKFIEDCRKADVEPLIQVPFWNRSPEFAAAMVRYINVEKKYDVRFWSISNEPDKNLRSGSREKYIQGFRAFRDAMKAVDSRILIFGPELASAYDWNKPAEDWLTPFLQANGDIVDVVSLHRYAFGGTTWRPELVMRDALHAADRVNQMRAYIQNITGRDIPLAFTEMNMSHAWDMFGEGSSAGFVASMWLAETFGQMADAGVTMVNIWSAHGNDSIALVETKTLQKRPTFFALRLYATYGDRVVPLASHVPGVSAHAALDSRTNKTTVVMINRETKPKEFQIVFNSNEEQKAGGIYMDRGSLTRMNFSMPPESIASLTLDQNFNTTQAIVYSRAMFKANKGAKISRPKP